jgi:hypothetical protein
MGLTINGRAAFVKPDMPIDLKKLWQASDR